jgi:hypothetical protein
MIFILTLLELRIQVYDRIPHTFKLILDILSFFFGYVEMVLLFKTSQSRTKMSFFGGFLHIFHAYNTVEKKN